MPEQGGRLSDAEGRRRSELVASLGAVRARIAEACEATGRDPRAVTLVAVTKTYPAADVVALLSLGVREFGESRDQEAAAKVGAVGLLRAEASEPSREPRWHFIGRVQSRKAASIAGYAAAVHSVDRPEIVRRLAEAVARMERPPLDVFVQVSLDDDPERGGAASAELPSLADAVAAQPVLRLCGLMAVPPIGADPDTAFARLAELSAALRERHPEAAAISAGMSHDLEAAIRHGSTHVRVGSALLGRRPPLFG